MSNSAAKRRPLSRDEIRFRSNATPVQFERQIEQLKERLRLAVIFGGNKAEPDSVLYQSNNTRSWKSYESVAEDIAASLRLSGFRNIEVIPEDMRMADRLRRSGTHMAWLNTGGVQGYNSAAHASAVLEMIGVPYVGHDPLAASTLDNKHAFKREAICAGLPTAPFCTWNMMRGPFWPDMNTRFLHAFGDYDGPFIVKPVSGRASLNVHVAKDRLELPSVVEGVYAATSNVVLIEKYLSGREFVVAVAGGVTSQRGSITCGREPFSFGVLERVLAKDEMIFTSMDLRPITGARFRSVSATDEPLLFLALNRLARDVYMEFNLSSIIRLDLRCDGEGNPFILEANPKPDLKRPSAESTSLIAAGLAQTNLSYDDLIMSLFADRLDVLFRHRRETVKHIVDLLDADVADADNLAPPARDDASRMVANLVHAGDEMRVREAR